MSKETAEILERLIAATRSLAHVVGNEIGHWSTALTKAEDQIQEAHDLLQKATVSQP
jgi:hypothetical protein